jgi:hypothetical protein
VINFLSIVISMGWTTGTFTVSGWSGKRERVALLSGPVIATTGLACLTAVALLPGLALMTLSAFVMGIGIGVYNVHLVARAMDSVAADEYRSTASALPRYARSVPRSALRLRGSWQTLPDWAARPNQGRSAMP